MIILMIYYNFITIILFFIIFILILKFKDFNYTKEEFSQLNCSDPTNNTLDCKLIRLMRDKKIINHISQLIRNNKNKGPINNNKKMDDLIHIISKIENDLKYLKNTHKNIISFQDDQKSKISEYQKEKVKYKENKIKQMCANNNNFENEEICLKYNNQIETEIKEIGDTKKLKNIISFQDDQKSKISEYQKEKVKYKENKIKQMCVNNNNFENKEICLKYNNQIETEIKEIGDTKKLKNIEIDIKEIGDIKKLKHIETEKEFNLFKYKNQEFYNLKDNDKCLILETDTDTKPQSYLLENDICPYKGQFVIINVDNQTQYDNYIKNNILDDDSENYGPNQKGNCKKLRTQSEKKQKILCNKNAGKYCKKTCKKFTKVEDGSDYRGKQDITKSGKTCQNWTHQSPHKHDRIPANFSDKGIGDHNYCRNPDGEPGIWCYTTDPNKRYDFCDPVEDGSDYRGKQDITKSGKTCQNWTHQSPHKHDRIPANFSDKGIGDHNYCRNPDGEPGIWCYTTDPNKRYDFCDPFKPFKLICLEADQRYCITYKNKDEDEDNYEISLDLITNNKNQQFELSD